MGGLRRIMIHDTHCHLDLYPDPYQVASITEKAGITTIAVTNLPSAYFVAKPHMRQFRLLKLAIGLHPLLANEHTSHEKQLFINALRETLFVGEIGLDYSKHGIETKEKQLKTFQFILEQLSGKKRFITLHSRQAESTVLDLLTEYQINPVVFHWYSGPIKTIDVVARKGHYFSVNTSMIKSKNGQAVVERIPKERLLTETDGPFIKVGNKPAIPTDVKYIHHHLSKLWNCGLDDIQNQLNENFVRYLRSAT